MKEQILIMLNEMIEEREKNENTKPLVKALEITLLKLLIMKISQLEPPVMPNEVVTGGSCKHIGAMYKVYEIHRPNVNGHEIYFGKNRCSICGYEADWQYDI